MLSQSVATASLAASCGKPLLTEMLISLISNLFVKLVLVALLDLEVTANGFGEMAIQTIKATCGPVLTFHFHIQHGDVSSFISRPKFLPLGHNSSLSTTQNTMIGAGRRKNILTKSKFVTF